MVLLNGEYHLARSCQHRGPSPPLDEDYDSVRDRFVEHGSRLVGHEDIPVLVQRESPIVGIGEAMS